MTITSPQHYFLYWSDDIFILNQGSVNLGLLVEIPQCDGSLSTSGICGEQMKSSVSCTGILIKVCVIQVLSYTAERFITSWPWAMAKYYLWTVVLLQHDLNLIIRWSVKILEVYIYNLPGPWFSIKMPSYQYRKSHCGDKTILRPSYLHNGISYTGKMASLYQFSPQLVIIFVGWIFCLWQCRNSVISLLSSTCNKYFPFTIPILVSQ